MRRRTGLTLLEVLVVVAILGVLLGLLLSAVVRVRSVSSSLQSQNNLRQIALACQTHQESKKVLPGTGRTRYQEVPIVYFDLLPYVEEGSIHSEFLVNADGNIVLPSAADAGPARPIKLFQSPVDGSHGPTAEGRGLTSYTHNPAVFGRAARLPESVPDGMSHTILFAERLKKCADIVNPWFSPGPPLLVFGAAPPPGNFAPRGGMCDPDRVCTPHADAILVALADGSVRRITFSVAQNNWVSVCDPSDGAPLGADW